MYKRQDAAGRTALEQAAGIQLLLIVALITQALIQRLSCLLYTSGSQLGVAALGLVLFNMKGGVHVLAHDLLAVSYTHLDVYKRQLLNHGESFVNDLLSDALLAIQHNAVDQTSDHLGIVNRTS